MKIKLKKQPKWLLILKLTVASVLLLGLFILIYVAPATPSNEILPDSIDAPKEVHIAGGNE